MTSTNQLIRDLVAKGLTQGEIVRRTGIPQSRMSRWMAGEIPRGADAALRLQKLHTELCGEPAGVPETQAQAGG